jgi:hypothetical protein
MQRTALNATLLLVAMISQRPSVVVQRRVKKPDGMTFVPFKARAMGADEVLSRLSDILRPGGWRYAQSALVKLGERHGLWRPVEAKGDAKPPTLEEYLAKLDERRAPRRGQHWENRNPKTSAVTRKSPREPSSASNALRDRVSGFLP